MSEWHAVQTDRAVGKHIAILAGTKPREPVIPSPNSPPVQKNGPPSDPFGGSKEIAEGLRQSGSNVSYETFPQYGHGDMIRVSLERALQISTDD